MKEKPFITLENISVRLRDGLYLENTSWQIKSNEHWAILGPNGSGKSTLVKSLFGAVPIARGRIIRHFARNNEDAYSSNSKPIGYVSSELHHKIIEREEMVKRFRDFSGKIDEVTTVKDTIVNGIIKYGLTDDEIEKRLNDVTHKIAIGDLLEKSISTISTGEMHKTLIARALMKNPKLLILDEPFEGLDRKSQKFLAEMINELMDNGMRIIFITHRFDEMMPNITNVLFLRYGKVHIGGKKAEVFNRKVIKEVYGLEYRPIRNLLDEVDKKIVSADIEYPQKQRKACADADSVLVGMKDVTVKYGAVKVLDRLNWIMKQGENWTLLGPGDSGKTTVLKLILGDNLQAYANEIYLFGKRKGSGESIWDIKKHIGYISSDLKIEYPGKTKAFDIVCSGFFDSKGLYRYCNAEQQETARKWIKIFDVESLADKRYEHLSSGQKQLILIARAMVKSPRLLILDEPCEGLDIANREKILEITEFIGKNTNTSLIYATHNEEEILPCMTNILTLPSGG